MRILKIEFENLNSLKGHWCIDLTNEAFKKNHNQFVICGETGSGKTTILDAITLALYGQTSRLPKIDGSNNEVMTRNTKFCMASVVYECRKGKFISTFSQSKKPKSGNLEKPSFTIADDKGNILKSSSTAKDLISMTVENIELDYEQFCRSIMLAQGEFNLFLEGDKNNKSGVDNKRKRAEILAKINGTEKYKNIGERVVEKFKEIESEYNAKKDSKNAIEILSEEEINELNEEKKSIEKANQSSECDVKKIDELIIWLDNLEEKKSKLLKAENVRKVFESKKNQSEKNILILEKAEKALNCKSEFVQYSDLKSSFENGKKEKISAEAKLNEINISLQNFLEKEIKAAKDYEDENCKTFENEKLWKDVRALDSKIQPIEKSFKDAKERKSKTESEYFTAQKNIEEFEKLLSTLNEKKSQCSKYLTENSNDKNLEKDVLLLIAYKKNLEGVLGKIFSAEKNQKLRENSISEKKQLKEKIVLEKTEIEKQLQEFINSEYQVITNILTQQLVEGKPCPVCGSLEHPIKNCCNEKSVDNKSIEVAQKINTLKNSIEEKEHCLQEIENQLTKLNADLENCVDEINKLAEEKKSKISEINNLLAKSNLEYQCSEEIEKLDLIINQLKMKSKKFIEISDDLENAEKKEIEISEKRKAVDLEKIKSNLDEEIKNFESIEKDLSNLINERKTIFGEKIVDEVENLFKTNLKTLFEKSENCKAEKVKCQNQQVEAKTKFDSLEKNVNDLEPKFNQAEEKLIFTITKNGFKNLEDYQSHCLDENQIEKLKSEREDIKKEDAETSSALEYAKNEFKICYDEKQTEKSKYELAEEKQTITRQRDLRNRRDGEINSLLKKNLENQKELEIKQKELEEVEKNYLLWKSMADFIGKKDGSDFEVFVQSMALQNLLVKANKYIYSITGKYSLVQKDNDMDFVVHDENYPDSKDDRPVSNLSGGEKFIISLSLALGIAELASRNVEVNSLFLDEGFGTLSGTPLIESINALKSLQLSGKTLGIITHVGDVIKEFDQKIHAEKSGGVSVLSGDGVSRLNVKN